MIDAANIDLKSFSGTFYRDLVNGDLTPVLETLKTIRNKGIHLEITNLVIPTRNDETSGLQQMCAWIKAELGNDTPLHFLRFYPLYKLASLPPTPVSTLEHARSIAHNEGLTYVYIGNVPGHEGENTYCPQCRNAVIRRAGYMVTENSVEDGKCKYCGNPIPGIW